MNKIIKNSIKQIRKFSNNLYDYNLIEVNNKNIIK